MKKRIFKVTVHPKQTLKEGARAKYMISYAEDNSHHIVAECDLEAREKAIELEMKRLVTLRENYDISVSFCETEYIADANL